MASSCLLVCSVSEAVSSASDLGFTRSSGPAFLSASTTPERPSSLITARRRREIVAAECGRPRVMRTWQQGDEGGEEEKKEVTGVSGRGAASTRFQTSVPQGAPDTSARDGHVLRILRGSDLGE
ncbi:hypothetical protein EYF80_008873 [Liparis tanakae]|uniref:Uncharacterized protein n=1 Tax=Liparis tanakae TaxID=230148 RepID=A0A4Z2ITF3_9TELE|nr:hypothetical protein EYF80_008873 [Liparis tanakae]